MKKKAQVTIFIILAILLVVGIGLYLLLRGVVGPGIGGTVETNPQRYIQLCAEEEVRNSVNKVIEQGGFLEPKDFKLHKDIKATYLCKNIGLFGPCINQHPMLLNEITLELKSKIKPTVDQCFVDLQESFQELGYDVSVGQDNGMEVVLSPGNVYLEIDRSVSVSKAGESVSFDNLRVPYKTSLYELAGIAIDIARNEAGFCYFEYLGYMHLYPQYSIDLRVFSDATKVYSIKDKYTEEEMNIAIRGCAMS